MIKGVPRGDSRKNGYLGYFDRLIIPIIENTYADHLRGRLTCSAQEEDLKERLDAAIKAYPETVAVLVRRHGIYGISSLFLASHSSLGEYMGTV